MRISRSSLTFLVLDALGGANQLRHITAAASPNSAGHPFPGQSRANRVMLAAPPRLSASKTTAGPPVKGGRPFRGGITKCIPISNPEVRA